MQSMIKRGVVLVGAVVLVGISQAQAAEVTAEYLYQIPNSVYFANTGYGDQIVSNSSGHAHIMDLSSQAITSLSAGGFSQSSIMGLIDTQRVGLGYNSTTGVANANLPNVAALGLTPNAHAYVWNGSSESGVDLNPAGASSSYAIGTNGTQQVGMATYVPGGDFDFHAMLWSGSAASALDLHPNGAIRSAALAVNGQYQGGFADLGTGDHAAMWQGMADSIVDLNPTGYSSSYLTAIIGDHQYGYGTINGEIHALSWNGTAESVVDLDPANPNYNRSYVTAASDNGIQIGYTEAFLGSYGSIPSHAAMWQGSSDSYVDLSALLNSGSDYSSEPLSIDGNVIYGVAWGMPQTNLEIWAVKWTIVPEPTSLGLLGIGALGLMRRRRMA